MDNTSEPVLFALGDIREKLGEMRAEGRSRDVSLLRIEALIMANVVSAEKVAARVGTLEHARSRQVGFVLALSAIGGAVATAGAALAKAIL